MLDVHTKESLPVLRLYPADVAEEVTESCRQLDS